MQLNSLLSFAPFCQFNHISPDKVLFSNWTQIGVVWNRGVCSALIGSVIQDIIKSALLVPSSQLDYSCIKCCQIGVSANTASQCSMCGAFFTFKSLFCVPMPVPPHLGCWIVPLTLKDEESAQLCSSPVSMAAVWQ